MRAPATSQVDKAAYSDCFMFSIKRKPGHKLHSDSEQNVASIEIGRKSGFLSYYMRSIGLQKTHLSK